ncbi:MAG TPA: helix-turn-helix domain-containing protein [Nitrospirota bacterium]|nr:helix-turn-helix domain-containing protein [Nitrospirota bacterium]
MHDVGSILREERKARGLEISDIAKRTHINAFYLKAMEEGKYHVIPRVFDKGYLRIYAKLLGLDAPTLIDQYELERKAVPTNPSLSVARSA